MGYINLAKMLRGSKRAMVRVITLPTTDRVRGATKDAIGNTRVSRLPVTLDRQASFGGDLSLVPIPQQLPLAPSVIIGPMI